MGIVCRPLLLYNEFLPAEIKEKRDWDYQAFGHHDGISIGAPVMLESTGNFDKLFDVGMQYEIKDSFFTQVCWGFHDDEMTEENFWKTEEPFIYIVLLQVSEKDVNMHDCKERLESLCQNDNENVSVLFYYSMDNSDLLMVVKCKSADAGFNVIDKLHYRNKEHSFTINNTYSILGVKREVIDNNIELIPEDEKVELLELQIIEKERGGVTTLYDKLCQKVGSDSKIYKKVILGTEDDAIFICDLPWRTLLSFYNKENGILCNSNAVSQKYVYAVSAHVMMKEKYSSPIENISDENTCEAAKNQVETTSPFCEKLINMVKNGTSPSSFAADKKNLLMLINAFRRFEGINNEDKPFTDYTFFPLFLPFYQFIRLTEISTQGLSEYYYHFMKCMKLCTQNFTKPERIYSQIPDFNLKYFDIPIKFTALYNAYIYSIKQVLNIGMESESIKNNKTSYEFMMCAGLNNNTEVKEIFAYQDGFRKLFIIETPERQMYQLKLMFFVLGHEVAHFVGKKIRNREKRLSHVVNICSRAICLAMKSYYEYGEILSSSCFEDIPWGETETNFTRWITMYLERYQNPAYQEEAMYYVQDTGMIQDNTEFNSQYMAHSDFLIVKLSEAIKEMLSNRGQDIFTFAIAAEYDREYKDKIAWKDFYSRRKLDVSRYINSFLGIGVNAETSLCIDLVLDRAIYLFKECYADMICLLMLRVSLREYIGLFTPFFQENCKKEYLKQDILLARMALVMTAMLYPRCQSPSEEWTEEDVFSWETTAQYADFEQWPDECKELQDKVVAFYNKYIDNKVELDSKELINKPGMIFCDNYILSEIVEYLVCCKEYFYINLVQTGSAKEGLRRIQRFYRMSDIQSAGVFFDEMIDLLKNYENDVYTEITGILKEDER